MRQFGTRSPLLLPIFGILASLALVACADVGESAAAQQQFVTEQGHAPDFSTKLYQGQEELGTEQLEFSQLLDQGKPVVLYFWAGLCPGCRIEMPRLQAVYDDPEYKDKLVMYGLDVGQFTHLGDTEDALNLLEELEIHYATGYTDDAEVVRDYKLLTMPSTYFITAEGEIAKVYRGVIPEETLEQILEDLVDGS